MNNIEIFLNKKETKSVIMVMKDWEIFPKQKFWIQKYEKPHYYNEVRILLVVPGYFMKQKKILFFYFMISSGNTIEMFRN